MDTATLVVVTLLVSVVVLLAALGIEQHVHRKRTKHAH